jgi:hypothetical protein
LAHATKVRCTTCKSYIHTRCLPNYSPVDLEYAKDEANGWTCPSCLVDLFPFNMIDSNQSILETINNPNNLTIDLDSLNSMIYDPLDLNEDDTEGALSDINPDQNFLKEIRGTAIQNCKYHYSTDLLDNPTKNAEISIFHLNIRSTPKNVDKLVTTLHTINTNFDILALSETWLKPMNADCYGINGYSHEFLTITDRMGGGVSIYITDKWNYKIRPDLSTMDDDAEMLWLEVDKDSAKTKTNLVLGVIYRKPGSNPSEFNHKLQEILTTITNEHKECVHFGDYNLNLLNSDTHPPTAEFANINFT